MELSFNLSFIIRFASKEKWLASSFFVKLLIFENLKLNILLPEKVAEVEFDFIHQIIIHSKNIYQKPAKYFLFFRFSWKPREFLIICTKTSKYLLSIMAKIFFI
jgi:hypothetical protein